MVVLNGKVPVLGIILLMLFSFGLFRMFQHEVSQIWFGLATHPRMREVLRDSGEDLKRLADLDPPAAQNYRARFAEVQEIRQNLAVLAQSRSNLSYRYEWLMLIGLGLVSCGWLLTYLWDQRRTALRLNALHEPLADLARGRDQILVPDRGRDVIGRIGTMIEKTAALVAGQRERLAYLGHLEEWQEAARHIAHEIRTPLSTMNLELLRLRDGAATGQDLPRRLESTLDSVFEEIERLKQFANGFTSIAGIGKPEPRPEDPAAFLRHFGSLFAEAWQGIALEVDIAADLPTVAMDRGMFRQVLMNLCTNSAQAMTDLEGGRVRILAHHRDSAVILILEDNGPGIPDHLRSRVFEPYVTSRKTNRGLGLGLAISRKIMLEHGGDLVLEDSSDSGTRWRLCLPVIAEDTAGFAGCHEALKDPKSKSGCEESRFG